MLRNVFFFFFFFFFFLSDRNRKKGTRACQCGNLTQSFLARNSGWVDRKTGSGWDKTDTRHNQAGHVQEAGVTWTSSTGLHGINTCGFPLRLFEKQVSVSPLSKFRPSACEWPIRGPFYIKKKKKKKKKEGEWSNLVGQGDKMKKGRTTEDWKRLD